MQKKEKKKENKELIYFFCWTHQPGILTVHSHARVAHVVCVGLRRFWIGWSHQLPCDGFIASVESWEIFNFRCIVTSANHVAVWLQVQSISYTVAGQQWLVSVYERNSHYRNLEENLVISVFDQLLSLFLSFGYFYWKNQSVLYLHSYSTSACVACFAFAHWFVWWRLEPFSSASVGVEPRKSKSNPD